MADSALLPLIVGADPEPAEPEPATAPTAAPPAEPAVEDAELAGVADRARAAAGGG